MRVNTVLLTLVLLGCSDEGPTIEAYSGAVTLSAWCDVSPTPCCNDCQRSPPLNLTITGAERSPSGDATLTLQISGDLDDTADEILMVSVEGVSLGTLFNGDPNDDAFDLPGDVITDCTLTTLTATIPLASLVAIASDGQIEISFLPRQDLNDIEDAGCDSPSDETITVTVAYQATVG